MGRTAADRSHVCPHSTQVTMTMRPFGLNFQPGVAPITVTEVEAASRQSAQEVLGGVVRQLHQLGAEDAGGGPP